MASDVFFHPIDPDAGHELLPADPGPGLKDLTARLGLSGAARSSLTWGLKVSLGAQSHSPAIDPRWARTVAETLSGRGNGSIPAGSFCFDTLSITTAGLDQAVTHLGLAKVKGFGPEGNGMPYLVADGPDLGPPLVPAIEVDPDLADLTLAAGLGQMDGLCQLTPVRPHPHAGMQGALMGLGAGLADREGKILLHRDIRPQVDTPLCAGCGSCLAVCLFDAIAINSGRAMIDHTKCTGCGECMNVCFMAGISADEAAGIPRFQQKVAAAALSARDLVTGGQPGRAGFFNFMVRLDRHSGGAKARGRKRLGDVGVLASRDPVALDRATWDLITDRMEGPLSSWSGFAQEPGPLLDRVEELGLGTQEYRLVEIKIP